MKKLSKKLHSSNETVQAFACACSCNCSCSCNKITRAAKRVTRRIASSTGSQAVLQQVPF